MGKSTISWYNESKYWPIILPIVNTWKSFGFQATIYYANVISIDKSYYEAAQLDGASKLQQVRYITLVLLKPVIIMMILLAVGKIFILILVYFIRLRRTQEQYTVLQIQ